MNYFKNLFLALLLICSYTFSNDLKAQERKNMPTYEEEWKKIIDLENSGKPQEGLKQVLELQKKAQKSKNHPQLIKTLIYEMKLRSQREEEEFIKSIQRTQELLKDKVYGEFPVKQILHSLLAELYWRYYTQNQYTFLNRTTTANRPNDIRTWDLKTLANTTLENYLLSLQEAEKLETYPIENISPILHENTSSRYLRPTLYDFLAHRAIDFLLNTQSGLPEPKDKFVLDYIIDSKTNQKEFIYLQDAKTFFEHPITTTDETSFLFHGIKIFQDLLKRKWQVKEKNPTEQNISAFLDADLKRIEFVYNNSYIYEKDTLYLLALENLYKTYSKNPLASQVKFLVAQFFKHRATKYNPKLSSLYKWDHRTARDICDEVIQKYPNTLGARNCTNLQLEIKRKYLQFTIEKYQVPNEPFIGKLEYQNVYTIYVKVLQYDKNDFEKAKKLYKDSNASGEYKDFQAILIDILNTKKPIFSFSKNLPTEGDFQRYSVEVDFPNLNLGQYVLLLSDSENFSYQSNAVLTEFIQVTNLSFIQRYTNGVNEFYVVHRKTGAPLEGVHVEAIEQVYKDYERGYTDNIFLKLTTNKNGYFAIPLDPKANRNYYVVLKSEDDILEISNQTYYETYYDSPYKSFYYQSSYYRDHKDSAQVKTFLFTDRAIYRPGQTLYFKGISLNVNNLNSSILANTETLVELINPNGQVVKTQSFRTNDYGTFHGNFILPSSGLNGIYTLRTTNNSHTIHVEEYKRPKFEVSIESPKGNYRLKEKVLIKGNAKTYSGAFVDGALVQYRVFRKAIFPPWWFWWRGGFSSSEQEIASGKAKTNEKGEFNFEFTAIPDETISPESKPYFQYEVIVDVTDLNGETQTGHTTVAVGYTALNLSLGLKDFIEKTSEKSWNLHVTNLSGEKENALVNIKIHKLKSPTQAYKPRKWEAPSKQLFSKPEWKKLFPNLAYQEEDKIQNWEQEKQVFQTDIDTSQTTEVLPDLQSWESGAYVLEAKTKDKFGEEVYAKYFFTLFGINDKTLPYKTYDFWIGVKTSGEPEEEFLYLTNQAPKTKALYEIEHHGKIIYSEWLEFAQEESFYSVQGKIKEEHRGNLGIHFTFVNDNRIFSHSETIVVPYSNKDLKISYETFRNKLYPGSKEEWRLKITGAKGEQVAAEMLASLYDSSLDAFVVHSYNLPIYFSYYPQRIWNKEYSFSSHNANLYEKNWNSYSSYEYLSYESLNWFGFEYYYNYSRVYKRSARYELSKEDSAVGQEPPSPAPAIAESSKTERETQHSSTIDSNLPKKNTQTPIRSNFQETAFFYPNLMTDSEGNIIIKFRIPDSLTKWKFLSFAHTKDLKLGFSQNEVITQKDLMVTPNPPRFFREGDTIYFGTKIINLTKEVTKGKVSLQFFDALNGKEISSLFGDTKEQDFEVKGELSTYVAWKLQIPKDISAVNYRIVAHSEKFSDGEEMSIPILTNRQLVTESLPVYIRGGEKRNFELKKLTSLQKNPSSTLTHHRLTFEFTPNPAWYAIQSLPYLMEYPYECVEQTFSRLYANSLSHHIVNSNPTIKKVFDAWKKIPDSEKGALSSNLEKNPELKNILLEQTPWVREAVDEAERKKRIALLFDINKMTSELEKALQKIREQQLSEGGWGWFLGFPSDRYMTSHIVSGFGQLSKLGVNDIFQRSDVQEMLNKAIAYLDRQITEDFKKLKRMEKKKLLKLEDDNLGYIQIQYLYTRSFFLNTPILKENKEALEYFQTQAKKYWLNKNIYLQGMLAIALHRWKEKETPKKIIESLKDKALHSEELGMYWKFNYGFYWYELPIETHSLMIELFEEVANDKKAVDSLKVWLLKQKQTTNWKTTKATANAIYALLLRGENWLNTTNDVSIQLGSQSIDPSKDKSIPVEEGTGYFKKSFTSSEISPEMGKVSLQKQKSGVSWGALYWQYFENLDKITTHETPLKLKKELYILENTEKGQILIPITQRPPKIGDVVKVRIELRVDRNMEYVHMKDMRASAFEPVDVFSTYKYQDGLYYYQSTRDASTDFFFGYLTKGTYVFEYSLRVTYKGDFSNGITTIQCMYAPEFISHSEGIRVKVEE